MSKDFYFHKWNETLKKLKQLVDVDTQYQVAKAHDATLEAAVQRLSSVLGQYMVIYNAAIECFQQNLQVQKTAYMDNIIKILVSRILELKSELEKLEGSPIQFIGRGLIAVHHTVLEIDMTAIPAQPGRPEHVQAKLDEILAKVQEEKEAVVSIVTAEESETEVIDIDKLWGIEEEEPVEEAPKIKVIEVPEEIRKTREYLAIILAHEKTRQVTQQMKHSKIVRENWEKELAGRLVPPASYEVRERSAQLIRKVFRAYFQLKRERIKNTKRDNLLGINICQTINLDVQKMQAEEMLNNRSKLHKIYEKEWLARREDLKQEFLKNKRAELCEEFRDNIREWFIEWFESVHFFYDIPKPGSAAIFRSEVPDPQDWLEENNALTIINEANKKKNAQDLKFEKMEAKRQKKLQKKEEQMKIKADALLLKKMMTSPKMHPGYYFPVSKQTDHILEVIDYYHKSWDMYDLWETLDVKIKYVHDIDVEDAIKEVKLEVLPEADEDMRQELRQLKQALKEDYIRNEEEMPVDITKPLKCVKMKHKAKSDLSDKVCAMIEDLAQQGFIVEYPKRKIEDFIGDANFGGEELRNQELPAFPFNFEIRAYWWERCREVSHGFRKILLVGPKNCGKTILVHTLASINNAVLIELDPHKIQGDMQSAPFLKRLAHMVVVCAKALQPSVILIKHVQKLFYAKIPPEEAELNLPVLRTLFFQKMQKKIQKSDRITIVGTCIEPWLAKASTMLKQFPVVLLLPDCTYSMTAQILTDWLVKHQYVIPYNFNVSVLAYVLQGYSFGFLRVALEKFMSAERIVKIAVYGLSPMDVYNFILEDDTETKVEYDKYLKWYTEKTSSGIKEMKHLQEQREYKDAVKKFEEKNRMKAKLAASRTAAGLQ